MRRHMKTCFLAGRHLAASRHVATIKRMRAKEWSVPDGKRQYQWHDEERRERFIAICRKRREKFWTPAYFDAIIEKAFDGFARQIEINKQPHIMLRPRYRKPYAQGWEKVWGKK